LRFCLRGTSFAFIIVREERYRTRHIKEDHPMAAEDNGYSAGAVGFAFLAGAVIGVGAALLLAPQSGAETRKLLKTYAEKAEEEVLEKAKEARVALDTAIGQGRQFINEKKSVLAAAFEAGKEAVKQRVS
jgi:gas vesicle protein